MKEDKAASLISSHTHTHIDSLWGKQLRAVLDAAQRCAIVVGRAHHEAVVIVASVKKLRIDV